MMKKSLFYLDDMEQMAAAWCTASSFRTDVTLGGFLRKLSNVEPKKEHDAALSLPILLMFPATLGIPFETVRAVLSEITTDLGDPYKTDDGSLNVYCEMHEFKLSCIDYAMNELQTAYEFLESNRLRVKSPGRRIAIRNLVLSVDKLSAGLVGLTGNGLIYTFHSGCMVRVEDINTFTGSLRSIRAFMTSRLAKWLIGWAENADAEMLNAKCFPRDSYRSVKIRRSLVKAALKRDWENFDSRTNFVVSQLKGLWRPDKPIHNDRIGRPNFNHVQY